MRSTHTKPTLVFFQYRYNDNLPPFLLVHAQDHVKCLSEFFDVTVINENGDYQEICDRYEPDLVLVESGVNTPTCRRLEITNVRACPAIPKVGFLNADAWCETRPGILSDMDHWGIETVFSISPIAAEHTPEIADRLFVWPNFIDPTVFRDYGQAKIIPVLFTGCQDPQYPWRHKIHRLVSESYPSLSCPHGGYRARSGPRQVMHGETYARTINASFVVPTCGTVARELVRKHFEIPASRSCLITERSPALEAAGFVDMQNCVFADETDVLDKLAYLFSNPDELTRITDAGHQLVHQQHTLKQRDQIFQWYTLHKNLASDRRIVQNGPFGPLMAVETSASPATSHVGGNGLHLSLLTRGDELLWAGQYEEAERLYLQCLNYTNMLPEPKLKLALCSLYNGQAQTALRWVVQSPQYTLGVYKALDPDPVEWAYFIVALLCSGQLSEAARRASQFPLLRHPELDRTRWAVGALTTRREPPPYVDHDGNRRSSVHRLPARNLVEWTEQLRVMLCACGQHRLAAVLTGRRSAHRASLDEGGPAGAGDVEDRAGDDLKVSQGSPVGVAGSGRPVTLRGFDDPLLSSRIAAKVVRASRDVLRRVEARVGNFLPYAISEIRHDELLSAMRKLMREERLDTALIVGASSGDVTTEAFLAGIDENQDRPRVFCLNRPSRGFSALQRAYAKDARVRCYEIAATTADAFGLALEGAISRVKEEHRISAFDSVLVNGAGLGRRWARGAEIKNELEAARHVLLNGTDSAGNYHNQARLRSDPDYVLVAHNPELRNGYSVFRRSSAIDRVPDGSQRADVVATKHDQDISVGMRSAVDLCS